MPTARSDGIPSRLVPEDPMAGRGIRRSKERAPRPRRCRSAGGAQDARVPRCVELAGGQIPPFPSTLLPNTMTIDYHMHTPLCRHAVGEPIEYARAAAAAGLDEICMTCHSPMPEWFDQWPRMTRAELPRYVAMVREAAEEAPVRLKLGIEADYFPGTESYVEEMLSEWPFEFVLGSVHILIPQYRERFGHL